VTRVAALRGDFDPAVMFALGRLAAALAAGRTPDPGDDLLVFASLLRQDQERDGIAPDPADLAHLAWLRRRAAAAQTARGAVPPPSPLFGVGPGASRSVTPPDAANETSSGRSVVCGRPLAAPSPAGGRPRRTCSPRCRSAAALRRSRGLPEDWHRHPPEGRRPMGAG